MTHEELIEKMIQEVMDEFDFVGVQRTMQALDWKWATDADVTKLETPSLPNIIKFAEKLLRDVAELYGDGTEYHYIECGGFKAAVEQKRLLLQFIASEAYVDANYFEEEEEEKDV